MIPVLVQKRYEQPGAPRIRGDDPLMDIFYQTSQMCSPAYAGMILPLGRALWRLVGAPRIRGDDPFSQ